jgi:oligoribonuclease (3'-5' exoribonuclease)
MSAAAKQERPTWLVWLDLETTGSDESKDRILEIGFVITDDHCRSRAITTTSSRPTPKHGDLSSMMLCGRCTTPTIFGETWQVRSPNL